MLLAAAQSWRSLRCVWSLTPLSCLSLVSALPLCHWQGVEKLVHYFSDKAWYSTISDFFLPLSAITFCFVLFCFSSLHDACQSVHEITGMLQMVPFPFFFLTFKMYLIMINLYVPRK